MRKTVKSRSNMFSKYHQLYALKMSEKSAPPPYSEHDPETNAPPPSGYGQAHPNQNQPYSGQNFAQPYAPQQALSNNSEKFSKSLYLLELNSIL